jgi:oligopeptide transport system substrate-binding protein
LFSLATIAAASCVRAESAYFGSTALPKARLGVRVKLLPREFNAHWTMVLRSDYTGVAYYGTLPLYRDPNGFFDHFVSDSGGNPSGWSDPDFVSKLKNANATSDHSQRLARLAGCETRLLQAMPILPLYHAVYGFLCKPYIPGVASHLFDVRAFKYVWIDKNWRPS